MKRWIAILLTSLALILFIYPSAFIYPRDTLPDNNDTRLIAYIIGQVQQNLLKLQPLYYGTFFAPDQSTLAYSDLFLTSAILTLPFRSVITSPIAIFNLALILGFLLTILSSFLLFEYFLKDLWITTLAVLLFNFSGYHFHYLPHLQIFSLWPLFLSVYFFLRFQKENRPLFLTLFFCASTLQLAESIFPVYLIFFAVILLVIPTVVEESHSTNVRSFHSLRSAKMTKYFLHFIPIWLFLLFPYYQLHTSLPEATRSIRDAAHFSLGLDQIFTQFHSWTLITIFTITQIVEWIKAKKKSAAEGPAPYARFLRTSKRLFCFSIIMSLGPVLKIFGQNIRIFGLPIPLPYALFYYLFPGFTGFRTPSRFIILALLAIVIIIGYQLKPIFEKLKTKTKFIILLLVLALLFLEADLPLKGYPVNINMHPVYQEVKKLPSEAVILELPIKLWNMPDHEIESIRSLYTLEHNHRRFGGFSGFATNSWIGLVHLIDLYGLSPENLVRLRAIGITHVIENNLLSPL